MKDQRVRVRCSCGNMLHARVQWQPPGSENVALIGCPFCGAYARVKVADRAFFLRREERARANAENPPPDPVISARSRRIADDARKAREAM